MEGSVENPIALDEEKTRRILLHDTRVCQTHGTF